MTVLQAAVVDLTLPSPDGNSAAQLEADEKLARQLVRPPIAAPPAAAAATSKSSSCFCRRPPRATT